MLILRHSFSFAQDFAVANRFLKVLEEPRRRRKMNPVISCRVFSRYIELTDFDVLKQDKRVKLAKNFLKVVHVQTPEDRRERNKLMFVIGQKLPSERHMMNEVAKESPEDWIYCVARLSLNDALNAWNAVFGREEFSLERCDICFLFVPLVLLSKNGRLI